MQTSNSVPVVWPRLPVDAECAECSAHGLAVVEQGGEDQKGQSGAQQDRDDPVPERPVLGNL